MASSIDASVPVEGNPTTASVRSNFTAAKSEIEALQSADTAHDAAIALKAPIASPTFTGTATIPTAVITNLTFNGVPITVSGNDINSIDDKAPIASPTFTGTATIPTAAITSLNLNGTTITATGTQINGFDARITTNAADIAALEAAGGVADATTTVKGIMRLATQLDVNGGTVPDEAVTPDTLDGWTGSAQLTTVGTINSGTWNGTAIGASYLPDASESAKGIVELADSTDWDNNSTTKPPSANVAKSKMEFALQSKADFPFPLQVFTFVGNMDTIDTDASGAYQVSNDNSLNSYLLDINAATGTWAIATRRTGDGERRIYMTNASGTLNGVTGSATTYVTINSTNTPVFCIKESSTAWVVLGDII